MILVNFASRSRPDRFFNCLDDMRATKQTYTVCAKLDTDDNSDYSRLSDYPEVIVKWGLSRSKVHAINRDIPEDWDILVNASDDIRWKPSWADEIVGNCEKDIFLHFPEEYADGQAGSKARDTISVVSIMDKEYYKRFRYVYHPDYSSLWCDNEATEVARRLGRYKFVGKVIFEHMHPAARKAKTDAQYKYTESFYHRDKRVFERRKANKFGL